jgi:hypothetical protein
VPHVIITAQVEDSKKWLAGFPTHGDLFRSMTAKVIHYGTTDQNEVALDAEVTDLAKYLELLASPATAKAMEFDGVKPDTVKVFVLDKDWRA